MVILALPCIVLLLIVLCREQVQQWLRGVLEKRWKQPARTANTLAAAGALSGLTSCGVLTIALIIFALAMVASVKLVTRSGWLDSRLTYADLEIKGVRRPLRLLYAAAAVPLLIS